MEKKKKGGGETLNSKFLPMSPQRIKNKIKTPKPKCLLDSFLTRLFKTHFSNGRDEIMIN